MQPMIISIVVAMDRNRLIGANNRLPWHLPADLRHFKEITMGQPIIMGRKTHESIGRPLPGRANIVVSRAAGYRVEGCINVTSLDAAFAAAGDSDEAMVIGGASLYEQALPKTQCIYLTRVDHEFAGDTWFPEFDPREWLEITRDAYPADAANPYPYCFVTMERR